MKKKFVTVSLLITMLLTGVSAHALTLADIELLVALGIITGEQAEIAKEAIGVSGVTSGAGASVRENEFSSNECLVLNTNLVPGLSGTAVNALQRFLQRQGHYTFNTFTGHYGPVTQTAVTDFQIATGLITSSSQLGAGSVGPLTREKIQEVSCNAANQPVVVEEEVVEEPQFVRRERPVIVQVEEEVVIETDLQSTLTYENKDDAIRIYRYAMDIDPDDDIEEWRLTLVCDDDQIEVSRIDLNACGKSQVYRASNKGKASVKIRYRNKARSTQTVGVGVEALDEEGNVIGEAEVIDQLPPAEPKPISRDSQGFQIVDGKAVAVRIPEQRLCTEQEQLEYLEYVMTSTIRVNDPVLPPLCWPGNLQCTYDRPPSFCFIVDGPNSTDLCEGGEFFYDGNCVEV